MPPRFSAAIRALAVLLLALALSPLTAPFATTSPAQLFADDNAGDTPLFGARKGPDEPAPALAAPRLTCALRSDVAAPLPPAAAGQPRGLDTLHLPLRI